MTGLSATPFRRDKLSRLIYWALGDKVHEIDRKQLVDNGSILQAEVIWKKTDFQPQHDPSKQYSKMLSELCQDEARNQFIVADVAQEARGNDGVVLVLSDRKSHCQVIVDLLKRQGIESARLTGDLSAKARQKVVEAMGRGSIKKVAATGQLIGECFDCKELSSLFMATPIKFSGRVLQYLGRILRPALGKEAKVFDYIDPVGVLQYAARGRQRVYERAA
jgi:superfamily II DNA or RNA helicase